METTTASPTATAERELVIERIFNAPRAHVWKAWTEPDAFAKWWGPKNFTATVKKMDVRVGGTYHYGMNASDGKTYWGTGTYTEVSPIDKLAYTDSFADENGNVVPSSYYGMPGMPEEMHVIVTFEDEANGKTKMTLHHIAMPAGQMQDMAKAGWNESFDKLEASLQ